MTAPASLKTAFRKVKSSKNEPGTGQPGNGGRVLFDTSEMQEAKKAGVPRAAAERTRKV
jgi:hypothetical protein